jgi:choline kinase
MAKAQRHIAPAKQPHLSDRLNVIIAAAGIGRRMKSHGPKSLLVVHRGVTLIEKQIRTILAVYPNADIVVACGFEGHKIRNELYGQFPVRFVYNTEYEISNVVHSVSLALDACLPGNILLIHGDIAFNKEAIQLTKCSSLLVALPQQIEAHKVGMIVQDQRVTMLSHGLPTQWGQIAYLANDELKIFRDAITKNKASKQWFLYEALNYVLHKGGTLRAHQDAHAHILEINRPQDIVGVRQI